MIDSKHQNIHCPFKLKLTAERREFGFQRLISFNVKKNMKPCNCSQESAASLTTEILSNNKSLMEEENIKKDEIQVSSKQYVSRFKLVLEFPYFIVF